MDWMVVIGTIIGGLLSILGSFFSNIYINRKEKDRWERDHRCELYLELINNLELINFPVVADIDNIFDTKDFHIDISEVDKNLNKLRDYINNNLGKLKVFLPDGIYLELMKLQAELYKASTVETVKIAEYKESDLVKAICHARKISNELKKDLLK